MISEVGQVNVSIGSYGMKAIGSYLYIASLDGLVIVNATNPAEPMIVGNYDTLDSASGIAVSDNYVYLIATSLNDFVIIDVSDPTAPTTIGQYDIKSNQGQLLIGGGLVGLSVTNNYAYLITNCITLNTATPFMYTQLYILDVSNPTEPILEGSYFSMGKYYSQVIVSGDYAYLRNGAEFQILYINDPTEPIHVTDYIYTAGSVNDVMISGNYAYIAYSTISDGSSGIEILDFSEITAPIHVGDYETAGNANHFTLSDNYLYIAEGLGIEILDVSDITTPMLAGTYEKTSAWAHNIAVSGNYVYVANYTNGLVILHTDTSDTDTTPPTLILNYPTNGSIVTTSTITVAGIATDDTGVTNLTVNDNPVILGSNDSFTTTVSLTSGVNTITVVATDTTGNIATETVTVTADIHPSLVFAITPTSRVAQVGVPVTLFMSMINGGTANATNVTIAQASSLAAMIGYQAWNGATLTGTPDTPVDIEAGATANFVLTINPTAEFASSAMTFNVSGTNGATAPVNGVNILTMAASTTPYADVIMMSTSLDVSTAVNTATAFALATTNVGTASATDVSLMVEIPSSITGLVYQVNETNLDGSIKGPATGLTIPVGGSPTFAVFLTPTQAIDYDPANNRIVLKLVDGSGKVVGAQSVAVSTT